jgi:hypothetical protein
MSPLERIVSRNVVSVLSLASLLLCGPAAAGRLETPDRGSDFPAASPVIPQQDEQRRFSFRPGPFDRCKYFMITETSADWVWMKVEDGFDQYIFTNSLGLMDNLDAHRAVGGSFDLRLARGHLSCAPALRYRQWFTRDRSVDLSVGYVSNHESDPFSYSPRLAGPIVNARLNLTHCFYVQGGLCRFEGPSYRNNDLIPSGAPGGTGRFETYGGIGLGGVPGVSLWGVELVGLGLLALAFSGMS